MVETNQDAVQSEDAVKKKKTPTKKLAAKDNVQDKPVVKKLPAKKDGTPVKSQQSKPAKTATMPKKQTVANIKKFLKGSWSELKKVHWPGRQQLIAYTGVVLVSVTFVALLIFAIDSILGKLLQFIIPK